MLGRSTELLGSFGVFDNPKADVEGSGADTGGWSDGGTWLSSCGGGADNAGGGAGFPGVFVDLNIVPDGVVTVMTSDDWESEPTSMRYPTGRKVLKPWIRKGCPWNKVATR